MSTQGAFDQPGGTTGGGYGGGEARTEPLTRRGGRGNPLTDRDKPFFMTSEFLTLIALTIAILIAAAIADNFGAARAWTLVAILGAAYMVSRGLSKSGRGGGDY